MIKTHPNSPPLCNPSPAAIEAKLGALVKRRNALRHAVMYLNEAGEIDLSAKARKSLYLCDQQVQGLERYQRDQITR